MIEKPRRRIWQIHLSTAILLMTAGGLLLGLNISFMKFERIYTVDGWCYDYTHGWPFYAEAHHLWKSESVTVNFAFIWNVLFALVALLLIMLGGEHWLARRFLRTKEQPDERLEDRMQ